MAYCRRSKDAPMRPRLFCVCALCRTHDKNLDVLHYCILNIRDLIGTIFPPWVDHYLGKQ